VIVEVNYTKDTHGSNTYNNNQSSVMMDVMVVTRI
jgi:hypothetical protein